MESRRMKKPPPGSQRGSIYPQDDDPLCCCEYRNRRGDRAHILQCCCACDEFDQAADNLFRGEGVSGDSVDEILRELDDRLRLPLPGGAWHIGVPGAAPWVVLPFLLIVGAVSARGLLLAAVGLLPSLYWWHHRTLRLRRRSSLLCSWMLASLAFEALLYSRLSLSSAEQAAFAIPLLTTLALFVLIKRIDPAHLPADAAVADANGAAARAVRCAVCGVHVPRYDHYCAWVDEPIGACNHRAYASTTACTQHRHPCLAACYPSPPLYPSATRARTGTSPSWSACCSRVLSARGSF